MLLLYHTRELAQAQDLRVVELDTGVANTRARVFYAPLGYPEESVKLVKVLPSDRQWQGAHAGHMYCVQEKTMDMEGSNTLLWPNGPPGWTGDTAATPSLTVFEPPREHASGAAIVVCPGGGYMNLASHEAEPVARWLNGLGVTAFLLRYRVAPHARHPDMLADAQRAVRTVRAHAQRWQIDPHRIGILGFSAGGHLASTAATHFEDGDPHAVDPVERASSRPDVAILIYPVITLEEPFAHAGSRTNLLGETPEPHLVRGLSSHLQVSPATPPTFLVHGAEDASVPCENSLLMALALRQARVPFELHIYEQGAHGFGLQATAPGMSPWTERCAEWLRMRGFLEQGS